MEYGKLLPIEYPSRLSTGPEKDMTGQFSSGNTINELQNYKYFTLKWFSSGGEFFKFIAFIHECEV